MILRRAIGMLIATVLAVELLTNSTVAHAQTVSPNLGGQNTGQAGYTSQQAPRGGGAAGTAAPPPRLPGQNCRGLGACAWGNQSEYTATCTPDARVCTSTSGGPDWPSMRCSANGAHRTCSNDNGGLIIPNTLPSTIGTGSVGAGIATAPGLAPNGQLGTGTSGMGSTSPLPGLCPNC
jgi:hypothetical protein